jgi:hypothetical protein
MIRESLDAVLERNFKVADQIYHSVTPPMLIQCLEEKRKIFEMSEEYLVKECPQHLKLA